MARRIAIKGSSGAGKSTLAAELSLRLRLPHIELDALHHGPNWSEPTAAEFRARVTQAMQANPRGWVIDGNYERKLNRLIVDAADTVVWLDLPLPTLLWRLWWRTSQRIAGNVELWNGNREAWSTALWGRESLFAWTIRSYVRYRREWPRELSVQPGYVRLRSPEQARHWLEKFCRAQQAEREPGQPGAVENFSSALN